MVLGQFHRPSQTRYGIRRLKKMESHYKVEAVESGYTVALK